MLAQLPNTEDNQAARAMLTQRIADRRQFDEQTVPLLNAAETSVLLVVLPTILDMHVRQTIAVILSRRPDRHEAANILTQPRHGVEVPDNLNTRLLFAQIEGMGPVVNGFGRVESAGNPPLMPINQAVPGFLAPIGFAQRAEEPVVVPPVQHESSDERGDVEVKEGTEDDEQIDAGTGNSESAEDDDIDYVEFEQVDQVLVRRGSHRPLIRSTFNRFQGDPSDSDQTDLFVHTSVIPDSRDDNSHTAPDVTVNAGEGFLVTEGGYSHSIHDKMDTDGNENPGVLEQDEKGKKREKPVIRGLKNLGKKIRRLAQ